MKRATIQRQAGVGLVTAIFLLVVIAGLAAAMVSVFNNQQAGSQLDQQGTRAYQAARAGIEWGLYRARIVNPTGCDATRSFALPSTSMLAAFTVTVSCTVVNGPGNDAGTSVRKITATACNQPDGGACGVTPGNNLDYVQRVIEVQL